VSVSPQTAAALVEGLARLGLDARRLGVLPLREDEDLARLWVRAIEATGRRTAPLEIGLGLPLGALGPVDYLAASSVTIGAALTLAQEVFPLVAPGVQLVVEEPRGGVRRLTIVDYPPFPGQDLTDSFTTGTIIGRLRAFASGPVDFPVVELTEAEPPDVAPWQKLLDAQRVRFGAARATLHLRTSVWTVPLRTADPHLLAMVRKVVDVDPRSGDALLMAVRTLAAQRLPETLELDYAAPALGLSVRTLQRKLASCGTSLAALADEVRRDRAAELVNGGLLTFGEVAARVGFAEQASFTRAWQRWFGVSPRQWREARLRPAAAPRRRARGQ